MTLAIILRILALYAIVRLTWSLLTRERTGRERVRKQPKGRPRRFDVRNRDVADAEFEELP